MVFSHWNETKLHIYFLILDWLDLIKQVDHRLQSIPSSRSQHQSEPHSSFTVPRSAVSTFTPVQNQEETRIIVMPVISMFSFMLGKDFCGTCAPASASSCTLDGCITFNTWVEPDSLSWVAKWLIWITLAWLYVDFKTCLQYYRTSRSLLDLGEMLMSGCLLDVVVILIFGQTDFISSRENPAVTHHHLC